MALTRRPQPSPTIGLSKPAQIDQNLAVAWTMVVFWGFVWPWLLVVMHKRPLRELVTRLIAEGDARPMTVDA
jgi:hypothetical protein